MLDLRTILKQVGVTAIYVTHDQTEAFAIADRVVVMNRGRIEQMDSPQIIFNWPATPFVAQFLGFRNLLAGTVEAAGGIATKIGRLNIPAPARSPGETVTVLLKPEAAFPADVSRPVTADINLKAIIRAISFRGRYYQVWVEAFRANPLDGFLGENFVDRPDHFGSGSSGLGERLMFELPAVSGWDVGTEVELWVDSAETLVW